MTNTLWVRFAEDAGLPQTLSTEERGRLERIFTPAGHWGKAVRALGLNMDTAPQLRWVEGYPYSNWSSVVRMVGGGWIGLERQGEGYGYTTGSPLAFVTFLVRQFRLSLYLARTLKSPVPQEQDARIIESLALGIALLALTMRLPKHDPAQLAAWLADPAQAPAAVKDIQALQLRRTALSEAWAVWFPARPEEESVQGPAQFWNEPPQSASEDDQPEAASSWKGIPVCPGLVTGRIVIMGRDAVLPETNDPLILVFPRARPETTEWFGRAAAVIYAEGGALSHACTLAREQGMPCVTAVGKGFLNQMAGRNTWLKVDGASGAVELVGNE